MGKLFLVVVILALAACGGGGGGGSSGPSLDDGGPATSQTGNSGVPSTLGTPGTPQAGNPGTPSAQGGPQASSSVVQGTPSGAPTTSRHEFFSTSVVTDPSTIPFPSGSPVTNENTNLNTFGSWGGIPTTCPTGADCTNYGPDVAVKRRVGYSKRSLSHTIAGENIWYGNAGIADLWLTYPADATASQLAVHIRTKRATPGSYGSISDDVQKEIDAGGAKPIQTATGIYGRGDEDKGNVRQWLNDAAKYGISVQDFFLTAQAMNEMSATWTGKVIAFDSASGSIMNRGNEIGGEASITVNFGNSPTVDVSLTNLGSARSRQSVPHPSIPNSRISGPSPYPSQSWTGLELTSGGFSDTSGRRSIEGTFRNQGTTTGTNANTAAGIFDVYGTMKGGFVATYSTSDIGN